MTLLEAISSFINSQLSNLDTGSASTFTFVTHHQFSSQMVIESANTRHKNCMNRNQFDHHGTSRMSWMILDFAHTFNSWTGHWIWVHLCQMVQNQIVKLSKIHKKKAKILICDVWWWSLCRWQPICLNKIWTIAEVIIWKWFWISPQHLQWRRPCSSPSGRKHSHKRAPSSLSLSCQLTFS